MSGEIPILIPDPQIYPEKESERTKLILNLRPHGLRRTSFHYKPIKYFQEEEVIGKNRRAKALAIILQARECPWVCAMCDLWRGTRQSTMPQNSILRQIEFVYKNQSFLNEHALDILKKRKWHPEFSQQIRTHPVRIIKLYNAGSFFDPRSIPPDKYYEIARRIVGFELVVVECHPKLVGDRVLNFLEFLNKAADEAGLSEPPQLEIGIGLEVADDRVLALLNKKMTCADFERACRFLNKHGVSVRAFVLANPPFVPAQYFIELAMKSANFAFDCGANRVVFIPTRSINGMMQHLEKHGFFFKIGIKNLEIILERAIELKRGIAEVDAWDIETGVDKDCPYCFTDRVKRIVDMGQNQKKLLPVHCNICEKKSEIAQ